MNYFTQIKNELQELADPKQASILQRFFKTGPGEYGENDVFLGIKVPKQREVAKKYITAPLTDLQKLLQSKVHEYRLTALLIVVIQFEKGDEKKRKDIYNFILKNSKQINNWDLVDLSIPKTVGIYLLDKLDERKNLYTLAHSKNIWEKRISILATYAFIRNNDFVDTLKISKILLNDSHDLIQKAVGWMLREVGNRNLKTEEKFLKKYYHVMPRIMLRYAIEKFPEIKRKKYLKR